MMKIPAGMIVKQIIDEKKLKAADVGEKMGISRQAVYQSYAKMSLSDGDIIRWSKALGVSKEEFIKRWNSEEQPGEKMDSGSYLLEHLASLEEQFKRLLNQIDVKDRQIEGLQETVKVLLGKYRPATPLSKVKPLWESVTLAAHG